MEQEKKYLIGGRFLVERGKSGPWFIKDRKGDLHEIFRVEPIKTPLIEAYKADDVYWILHRVPLESYDIGEGSVAIKGNEVVSYGFVDEDKLYINHYGKEFFGRVDIGKRKDISIKRNYLEVKKHENDFVIVEHEFLGKKLTPMIEVITPTSEVRNKRSKVVCFPEFNKVYSGMELYVEKCFGCLNVWVSKNQMLSLYALFEDGEEYLVYEGEIKSFKELQDELPALHRLGNIMVVYLRYGRENEIVHNLRRIPSFDYMYVKEDLYEGVYISFNLKRWGNLGRMAKLIFKGGEGGIHWKKLYFLKKDDSYALEIFAKKLSDHPELLPSPAHDVNF